MIHLTCTHCQAALDIDDGFAGGVCRCQHCGTIQTVPKKSKRDAGPAASKALYRTPGVKKSGGSTDLDALADAVTTSSGLSSRRLRQKTIEPATPAVPLFRRKGFQIAVVIGSALLVILALFLLRKPTSPSPAREATAADIPSASPGGSSTREPGFLGVAIDAASVIYVLDRGSGTSDWFSYLLEATFKSTETLGSDRKFQIIFWSNGDNEAAYPSGGPEFATTSIVAGARKALDSVEARGQSDAISAVTLAFKSQPDLIILATGKGSQLDESFAQQALALRGSGKTRVNAIDIADSEIGAGLTNLARQTGGKSMLVPLEVLKAFSR